MTYRTGNHWGVTIVREGERTPEGHVTGADQLVAVVVNGDQALAERICALLNADDRDARRKPTDCPRCGSDAPRRAHDVCEPCGDALTQEVDGDSPGSGLRSTESAQEPSVGGSGRLGAQAVSEDPAITEDRRCRNCGASVERVTAEPHHEMAHPGGYMVAASIARTLHPCGHVHIQAVI